MNPRDVLPNQRQRQPRSQNRRDRSQNRAQSSAQTILSQLSRFFSSWRFNIFLMVVNLILIIAYSLILHHQHFKETQFQLESLMDGEKVPQTFMWGIMFVIAHFIFLVHKGLESTLLEWKPFPQNPSQIESAAQRENQHVQMNILNAIVQEHYFFSLIVLYLMDKSFVFPTFFETLVFVVVYTFHSFVIASEQLIFEFNKKIIDTQISFSSSLLLKKNEIFQRRVKKVESYQLYLLVTTLLMTLFVAWLFLYSNLTLLSLLTYPGLKNLLKLVQDIYNFRYQIKSSIGSLATDEQIITKTYLNFALNITIKFLDTAFCLMIIYIGGFQIGWFPMIHIFISQQIIKQVQQFYQEIDKVRKFRNFLRNINNDYPLVSFNQQDEKEDCAICKETMNTARKLPCGHCFHWFCIIQLIESGSRNCPICRGEFNQNRAQQQPMGGQNQRQGGNIFSFRLGGWLPNISVRMVRQRGPVIPFNQAVERIREIFPYLQTPQIVQELRQAGGHIDQAIINISENVQRGMYPGINQ